MSKNLNIKTFSHFLFDYDGLLVDSEKLYFKTWCLLLNKEGQKVCYQNHQGKLEGEVYAKVKSYLKEPMSLKEVSDFRRVKYDKLVNEGQLQLAEGIKELLIYIKKTAPMSIVSNSTKDVVEKGIKSTGIKPYFDNLFCFSDKVKNKPAPDIYNLAIDKLNINNKKVLALEDSKSGIIAAKTANIQTVCINSNLSMENYCNKLNIKFFRTAREMLINIKN